MKTLKTIKEFFLHTLAGHSIIALLIVALIIKGISVYLNVYTRHEKNFPTPDFEGLNKTEVAMIAEEHKLRYEISDSVFDPGYRRGTVISQTPPAGFKVKKNRRIFLTINSTRRKKVKMPNCIDQSIAQAKANLSASGLKMGQLIYFDAQFQHLVYGQKYKGKKIKAGDPIAQGERIDLMVGRGYPEDETIKMTSTPPSVIGLTLNDATNKVTNHYLNIGRVKFEKDVITYDDSISAKVYKQRPRHSVVVELPFGEQIDVWLTTDKNKQKIAGME